MAHTPLNIGHMLTPVCFETVIDDKLIEYLTFLPIYQKCNMFYLVLYVLKIHISQ